MILIRRCKKLFRTSYVIAHNLNDSQFYITDLCNKYNSLSFKMKIPVHTHNLQNVENLNYSNNIKCKRNLQSKENLLYESINNHNVNLTIITSIIEELESGDYNIPETLSLKLLKCCGYLLYNEPLHVRQELTNRVWNFLEKTSTNLTINHYHALLQTYIDNDYRIDPKEFLNSMKIKPEYDTYCLLLQVLPNTTDCAIFESLVKDVHEADSRYNNEIYDALVYAYAINGNTEKAKDIIELMKKQNIQPSATTYAHLMYAFAKNNDTESLVDIIWTYKPSRIHVMKVIKFLSLSGNGICIPDILTCLEPLTVEDYNVISVIVQLVHAGHYLDAYKVITHIPVSDEIQHVRETFALRFLEEMIKLKIDKEIILQFINDFATKQCILDIWEKAALLSLQRTNEALAIAIFNKMKTGGVSISCDCFWPFLLDENVHDQEAHTYSIIRHMIDFNVKIDSKTFTDYIFPYIDTSNPVATLDKMIFNRLSLTSIIEPFVHFLLNSGRLEESVFVCSHFKKKVDCVNLLNPLYFSYMRSKDINSCIDFLFKSSYNGNGFAVTFLRKILDNPVHIENNSEDIVTFLTEMNQYKALIPPSDRKYIKEKLLDSNCPSNSYILQLIQRMTPGNMDNYNTKDFIHPEYMNPEQLYSHFHELKCSGKNTRGVLRKLLLTFCNRNDTRVNEIIQEMNCNNLKWTPGMKLCLFDYYVRNEMIDEASLILREVQSQFPQFRIDNFKIINFSTLLIKQNKIDEALDVVNTCIVNHKPDANLSISNLLNLLITKDTSNYTETMVELLVKRQYCTNYDRILKYLVLVHMSRDDIKSATDVFTACVKQYNKTPAKQELMVKVLKSLPLNWHLLQNIYDLIVKVHGKDKANVNLVIAFSLCNNMKELQHLLKDSNIQTTILLRQLNYLPDDDIITATLRILESVEDTTKINLEPICNLILYICNKRDDYKLALELEKWIKVKNIKCDAHFHTSLSKLLSSNLQSSDNIINGNQ